MKPAKRSIWVLVLLALVASMTISSVLSTGDIAGGFSDSSGDEWDEGFDEDYSGEEESSEFAPQEYGTSVQQPNTGHYAQVQQTQANYGQPPPPQYQQVSQPQQYQPHPQVVEQYYQPPNYTVHETPLAPLPPAYQQQQPQTYQQQAPSYQPQPQAPAYQPPTPAPVPAYQPPTPTPAPAYQPQPQAPTYQPQPHATTYKQQPQTPTYQPQPQAPAYQAPPPPQPQTYQPPQPAYQRQQQQTYQQPPKQPTYQAPAVHSNYSVTPAPVKQVANYTASGLAQKYGLTDLASFTTPFGHGSNHWSLHYYRYMDKSVCPKPGNYSRFPTHKDIENAFSAAMAQLGYYTGQKNGAVQYLNASQPTFAARHQIASYLSQKSARMDEEGLLVEFASMYLADRLCLTKWDRLRYLPSYTKLVSASNYPSSHSCSQYHAASRQQWSTKACQASKYRTFDGFCNNPWHPYWGKTDVCHIRLLTPDYADGIQLPREAHNQRYELPNPRLIANTIHSDVPIEGPYNLMKMQWGQFINHDISNTALSAYDGLVDCCKSRNARGCWPMTVMPGDKFYGPLNVTCLNFIRSGACPTCQLGPRQQTNKNTAFLDASHVYGNTQEQANELRAFVGGLMKTSPGKNGEQLLPVSNGQEQCFGVCYKAGDARVNQHPALTALHVLLVRNHNRHAQALARRHPNWNDEYVFQEARRLNIAEYQMITYAEYLPIVFGPSLSAYFKLTPHYKGFTEYNPKVDPTTWNEYTTAACRFGHSQISSLFSLTTKLMANGQQQHDESFRLKDWFFRPSLLAEGKTQQLLNGLLGRYSQSVDPWVTTDVRNYLYKSPKESFGGDLVATNIWRGRDHGLPGYVHYVEYCFNHKVRGWKDLAQFVPPYTLNQMRRVYKVVENIDLFTGGLSERHFPGADIGPTFACINGIQYYHLKFGDRYFFEHANQAGSFNQAQLDEIRRSSLARLLCRAGQLQAVPKFAFMKTSQHNPLVNCSHVGELNYNLF